MSEDENETGLGYDSNGDTDEVENIDDKVNLVRLFRLTSIIDQESNDNIEVEKNLLEFKESFRKNVNPDSLLIHCVPDDLQDPPPAIDKDEPPFECIDNPGE